MLAKKVSVFEYRTDIVLHGLDGHTPSLDSLHQKLRPDKYASRVESQATAPQKARLGSPVSTWAWKGYTRFGCTSGSWIRCAPDIISSPRRKMS